MVASFSDLFRSVLALIALAIRLRACLKYQKNLLNQKSVPNLLTYLGRRTKSHFTLKKRIFFLFQYFFEVANFKVRAVAQYLFEVANFKVRGF